MAKKFISIWTIVTAMLIAIDAYLIAFYAPIEINQGAAQKIFYWHVPSAMTMMTFYIIGGVASVVYLIKKNAKADALAVSFIEIGFLFCTIVLVTGPLWAKPVWGAWWTWEPRLTSTLFVWLVFFGYFMLRASLENKDHARLYGSVLAIFGCLHPPAGFKFALKPAGCNVADADCFYYNCAFTRRLIGLFKI
ncbi:MAG: cytochrome c biogenesis protein CcsA [Deltaproteobacteria bacterium]|nr:cytochrome c biogenesis protein CcsA [Deltaproteobacteria bacterium]